MVPLMIDMQGKKVMIFGGGDVAARKASYFTGCTTVVVSRSFSDSLKSTGVERRRLDLITIPDEEIRAMVNDAFLVIAATSDERLNNRIGSICREVGVLFNNAKGDPGDVILPAMLKGENFLVAVTTFGKSPAFSRYLRSDLERSMEDYDRMIVLQEKLRSVLKGSEDDQKDRSSILWRVITDPLVWASLKEGPIASWKLVEEKYLHG